MIKDEVCGCGFQLWRPLAASDGINVGLYDDARFPGRLIVSLQSHYDSLEEVSGSDTVIFFQAIKEVMKVQRSAMRADRVNVAILGNQESHVHAHLIPRYRDSEPMPDKSPWDDPRARCVLTKGRRDAIESLLRDSLGGLDGLRVLETSA